jgi:tetratricopeptide (TPR) repeat protein
LTSPGGAFDLLKSLQAVEPPSATAEDMAALLGALEDKAQQVIVDYGSGEQFPNDPLRLDAARFNQAADYFEHAATLERQARKDEMVSRALFCAGRAKLFDGPGQDIRGAADDLEKAARRHPDFPEPYNAMGIVHLALFKSAGAASAQKSTELDKAAKQFGIATTIARAWAYPRHNLALTYTERGDFRRAEKEYTKAIEFTPFHPYLQYNLGYLLQNENRLREAERQYKSAVNALQTIIGKHVTARDLALARSGDAYYQERSVLEGKIVVALEENLAETYNALGTVRENLGDSAGAEIYYGKALANADLKETRHNLASLEVARRRKRGLTDTERTKLLHSAEDLWLLNLSLAPDHRPSLLGLARAYREDNRPVDAIQRYREVLRLDAGHIAAREELAQSLVEAGQNDDAVRAFEEAIRLEQAGRSSELANPALYEAFGDLYWRLRRTGDACRQYNAAAQAQKTGLGAAGDLKTKLRRCAAK